MDAFTAPFFRQRPTQRSKQGPRRSIHPENSMRALSGRVPSRQAARAARGQSLDQHLRRQIVGDAITQSRMAGYPISDSSLDGRQAAARTMNSRNINQQRRNVSSNQELLLEIEKLQQLAREQANQIAELEQQVEIKNDAIQRQTEDIKKLDGELVWTRASLYQAEHSRNSSSNKDNQPVDWQDKYARLQAELDNLRKRWEIRSTEKVREERNRILMDMLPLADHLELALKHQPPQTGMVGEATPSTDTAFIGNIRATLSAFISALQRYNVEPIEALGQPFDPSIHEAIGQSRNKSIPADHVAQVIQTGYRDGDRLLRPARVMVSTG